MAKQIGMPTEETRNGVEQARPWLLFDRAVQGVASVA